MKEAVLKEPALKEKIAIIKKTVQAWPFRPSYFDFYEDGSPTFVYPFYVSTNENLNYMRHFTSFEGKDVLVPTASGDHALNAILLGAKSVETFDINSIAKIHYDLKENAVKVLSRKQFLEFYSPQRLFNLTSYNKIKPFLKLETRLFFDELFCLQTKNRQAFNLILAEAAPSRGDFIRRNPYLKSDEAYQTLQSKLQRLANPVRHKVCPAHEIQNHFGKKDILVLSNITSCYYGYDKGIKPLLKSISQVLVKNGNASVDYIYGTLNKFQKFLLCRKFRKSLKADIQPVENPHTCQKDLVVLGRSK